MSWSTRAIKRNARSLIKSKATPSPLAVALVFTLITAALTFFAERLGGEMAVINSEQMNELYRQSQAGIVPSFQEIYDSVSIVKPESDFFSELLQMALQVLTTLVAGGFGLYALRLSRGEQGEMGNLLDGFSRFYKLAMIHLLKNLAVSVGMFCFIIPGVRLLYAYRQAVFLMWDHPDWTPIQCLRYSRLMMKGRKWKLFSLDFSFILWLILCSIPLTMAGAFYAQDMYVELALALLAGCGISAFVSLFMELSCALWYNIALGLNRPETETGEKPPWEY